MIQPPSAIVQPKRGLREVARSLSTRRTLMIAFGVIVFAVALQQNFSDITKTRFHPDESRWLNRSIYTQEIFHPLSATWEDRYLTRGQPPGGSYITGIGLLLQGRDLDTNGPWEFTRGGETVTWWNTTAGKMPSWNDLEAARRTSSMLGAITALALFLIVARMTTPFGGLIAGLFFAVHPLSVYLSTLGVSDAAFTFLTAMAALSAMALAQKQTWPRAILLGLLLGAGTATKLSPIFIAVGLAGLGMVFEIEPVLRRVDFIASVLDRIPGFGTPEARQLSWKLISLPIVAGMTFFLTYPFLWPAPIARTQSLFQFRQDEMASQARIWPQSAVSSRLNAVERTWTMLEDRYSSTGKVYAEFSHFLGRSASEQGIDVVLGVAGVFILLVLTWRRGFTSPTFMGLAVAGLQALIILMGLKIDFDRYYLPIVFIFAMGVGVLASALMTLVLRSLLWFEARTVNRLAPVPTSAD